MNEQVLKQEGTEYPRQDTLLDDALYQFHGFRVVDANGQSLGLIDWVWADAVSGHGEFIGVRLRWLRGTVLAIPTAGVRIDRQTSTVQVAYIRKQIKQARRCSIDRPLAEAVKCDIRAHYAPAHVTVAAPVRNQAARQSVRNMISVRAR